MPSRRPGPRATLLALLATSGAAMACAALAIFVLLIAPGPDDGCDAGLGTGSSAGVALGPPGTGRVVGASEYGGPGDPGSTARGSRGDDLLIHPDTYAELGGLTWGGARAMGGLAYMTPLRITYAGRSAVAYKRDFGLGGGPVAGLPRVIDLWWQFAGRLGVPYEDGRWSGPLRIERPPVTGASWLLGTLPAPSDPSDPSAATAASGAPACDAGGSVAGERAAILPSGLAAVPEGAPDAVRSMIAAGNEIAGRPYVYGGGHGTPLDSLSAVYDCSSSVEHLLFGGGLVDKGFTVDSGALMSWGLPGPGRWVTVYASPDHVFAYVAGLRWDTHNAAGPGDGSPGVGWHPLVRSAAGFVARHPAGL